MNWYLQCLQLKAAIPLRNQDGALQIGNFQFTPPVLQMVASLVFIRFIIIPRARASVHYYSQFVCNLAIK